MTIRSAKSTLHVKRWSDGRTGLSELQPPFTFQRVDCKDDSRLPTASICFNILKLPTYSSAALHAKLLQAIRSGSGFYRVRCVTFVHYHFDCCNIAFMFVFCLWCLSGYRIHSLPDKDSLTLVFPLMDAMLSQPKT
jgi:hypothetical protein